MNRRRGLAMGVLIFASFMDLMDATIVNVALPVDPDRPATPRGAQLEWVVGGYLLAFAVLMITGGRLGDIVGRRRLFVLGVRRLHRRLGAGLPRADDRRPAGRPASCRARFAAMMVPQVLSSLQALYAPRERAPMYGVIGAVSGLSAVIGPVLGGWLVSSDAFGIGWRSIFLINLPIGLLSWCWRLRWVPETPLGAPAPARPGRAGRWPPRACSASCTP